MKLTQKEAKVLMLKRRKEGKTNKKVKTQIQRSKHREAANVSHSIAWLATLSPFLRT